MLTFQSLPKYLLWVGQHNEIQCNTYAELQHTETIIEICTKWSIESISTNIPTYQFQGLFHQAVWSFHALVFLSIFWWVILRQSYCIVLLLLVFFFLQSMELTDYKDKNVSGKITIVFVCNIFYLFYCRLVCLSEPVGCSTCHTMKSTDEISQSDQWASWWSMGWSVSWLVGQWVGLSIGHWVGLCIGWSVKWLVSLLVDQSMVWSSCLIFGRLVKLGWSVYWSVNGLVCLLIGLSINWSVGQWIGVSIGWLVNGLVCLLVGRSIDWSVYWLVGQWVGLSIGWLVNGLICLLVGQRSMVCLLVSW